VVLAMNLSASSKSKIAQTPSSSSDKRVEPENEVVAPAVVLTSMKKVSQNIAKWGERKSELNVAQETNETKEQSQQKPLAGPPPLFSPLSLMFLNSSKCWFKCNLHFMSTSIHNS
jgi:hypothetical protein